MEQQIKRPRDEIVWCSYHDISGHLRFLITSKASSREYFYLYELKGTALKRLGKSRSPSDLEKKYGVMEQLGGVGVE